MLDQTDRKILQCLQRDSRMQWQEIGKLVHLTGQAVAVRIRSMQDEGIIEAFTVNLNHEKLGRPIDALITVFMSSANHASFQRFLSDSYIIELLATVGFKRLTLLRYKPPGDINRWVKEKPDEYTLLEFERKLSKTVDTYPHIQFRVDCGLAFLERKLPSQIADSNGIRGCTANY